MACSWASVWVVSWHCRGICVWTSWPLHSTGEEEVEGMGPCLPVCILFPRLTFSSSAVLWQFMAIHCLPAAFLFLCFFCSFLLLFFLTRFCCQSQGLTSTVFHQRRWEGDGGWDGAPRAQSPEQPAVCSQLLRAFSSGSSRIFTLLPSCLSDSALVSWSVYMSYYKVILYPPLYIYIYTYIYTYIYICVYIYIPPPYLIIIVAAVFRFGVICGPLWPLQSVYYYPLALKGTFNFFSLNLVQTTFA